MEYCANFTVLPEKFWLQKLNVSNHGRRVSKIMCGKELRPHEDRRDSRENFGKLFMLCSQFFWQNKGQGKSQSTIFQAMKLFFTAHTAGWCNKFLPHNKHTLSCCWYIVMEVTFKTLLCSNNRIHLSTQQHLKTWWKNCHFYE